MSAAPDNPLLRTMACVGEALSRLDRAALDIYVEELLRWNPQIGLVSKQGTPEVAGRLIAQAVDLWDFAATHIDLPPGAHVADVGSGGGLPGLVWKFLALDTHLTLIERKTRRAHFLERVIRRLDLTGVETVRADARELQGRHGFSHAFELVVAVAVALPATLAGAVEPLLRPGGCYVTIRRGPDRAIDRRIGRALVLVAHEARPDRRYLLYRTSA